MAPYNGSQVFSTMPEQSSADSLMTGNVLGTALVIDVDRQYVRSVLFDSVEGHGRFVSGTTVASTVLPPIDDPAVAIRETLNTIEDAIGRQLLAGGEIQIPGNDADGVDFLTVTGMPVTPTRLGVVATGAHQMTHLLVGVARTTPTIVREFDTIVRTEDGILSGTKLEHELRAFQPDVIMVLAGNKTQSEWPTVFGTLKDLMTETQFSQIVILASEQLQQLAIQLLGVEANLTGLDPNQYEVHEVTGAVEMELHSCYENRLTTSDLALIPNGVPFVGRGRAGDLVTRFLARRLEQPVVSVTIGDGTMIHWSNTDSSSFVNRPDFDLNCNIKSVLELDLNRILSFLPFGLAPEDLRHWILNRALRPLSVSDVLRDQIIESAIASEIIRSVWISANKTRRAPAELVIGGPAFASWANPALGLLSLLNGLEPMPESGMVEIIMDVDGLLDAAGAIGDSSPAIAADVVERDLAIPAANVIIVEGSGEDGDLAVRGEIRYEDGENAEFSILFGRMIRLPLAAGESATMTLVCDSGFSIAGSAAGDAVEFGRITPLRGGMLGVVIDARGHDRSASGDSSYELSRVANWFRDLEIST